MAVTQTNVISGITSIHWIKDSTYAAANNWNGDPAAAFAAESPTDVGYISGPATLEYSSEQEKIDVEQDTFPIKHLLKAEVVTIKFNIAEAALASMQLGVAGMATPSGTVAVFGPVSSGSAASTIHHYAIRITATGPSTNIVRRVIACKAYATGNMGVSYTKSGIQMIPVEFSVVRVQEATGGDLAPSVWIVDSAS